MRLYYKDDFCTLIQGDSIEVMTKMTEKGLKFDAIITDPPYGTTSCKWDAIIPFEPMWERLNLLRKDTNSSILLLPDDGLWYLGEQCGLDQYLDIPSGDAFDVDVFDLYQKVIAPEKYDFGFFHGWKIEDAEKYLEEITQ